MPDDNNNSQGEFDLVLRPSSISLYEELQDLAGRLRGVRVLHINATSFGGGVAEILYTLVPLARDAGLEVEWAIMFGAEPFFNVTKKFHNALQGADYELTIEDRAIYEEYNRRTARALVEAGEEWDANYNDDDAFVDVEMAPESWEPELGALQGEALLCDGYLADAEQAQSVRNAGLEARQAPLQVALQ